MIISPDTVVPVIVQAVVLIAPLWEIRLAGVVVSPALQRHPFPPREVGRVIVTVQGPVVPDVN